MGLDPATPDPLDVEALELELRILERLVKDLDRLPDEAARTRVLRYLWHRFIAEPTVSAWRKIADTNRGDVDV